MRRKRWLGAIAMAVACGAASAQMGLGPWGHAGAGGYGRGMGPGAMTYDGGAFTPGGCGLRAGAAEELGLTEEQRARIAAIFQESWPERVALMDEMHELRVQQLRERTPNFEAMAPLRERMFALNRATRERVDTVLTDEQRERLNDAWWGFGGRWR